MPYRIIGPNSGPHSATFAVVFDALAQPSFKATDEFRSKVAPAIWNAADRYGIDGVGLTALAGKETGFGVFGGAVTAQFYNPGGLKIRHQGMFKDSPKFPDGDPTLNDQPLAHQLFASWPQGALAVAQHVFCWTGGDLPLEDIVDPRWWLVKDILERGQNTIAQMWSDFGNGRWNTNPTYGSSIETIMDRLRKGRNQ